MHKAIIHVWAEMGNTVVTKRKGPFCDQLGVYEFDVQDPAEARQKAQELLLTVPHAHDAHFDVPTFKNQNIRAGWVNKPRET